LVSELDVSFFKVPLLWFPVLELTGTVSHTLFSLSTKHGHGYYIRAWIIRGHYTVGVWDSLLGQRSSSTWKQQLAIGMVHGRY